MQEEYDLSKMKSRPNPYAKRLTEQEAIPVNSDVLLYFKEMAEDVGIPYQNLINLYLQDCMTANRKLNLNWGAD